MRSMRDLLFFIFLGFLAVHLANVSSSSEEVAEREPLSIKHKANVKVLVKKSNKKTIVKRKALIKGKKSQDTKEKSISPERLKARHKESRETQMNKIEILFPESGETHLDGYRISPHLDAVKENEYHKALGEVIMKKNGMVIFKSSRQLTEKKNLVTINMSNHSIGVITGRYKVKLEEDVSIEEVLSNSPFKLVGSMPEINFYYLAPINNMNVFHGKEFLERLPLIKKVSLEIMENINFPN